MRKNSATIYLQSVGEELLWTLKFGYSFKGAKYNMLHVKTLYM